MHAAATGRLLGTPAQDVQLGDCERRPRDGRREREEAPHGQKGYAISTSRACAATRRRTRIRGRQAVTAADRLAQSHFFQRKKPSIPTIVATNRPSVAKNPAPESKPGKRTFIPKKPVRNVSGSITTLKIVRT